MINTKSQFLKAIFNVVHDRSPIAAVNKQVFNITGIKRSCKDIKGKCLCQDKGLCSCL